MAFQPIVDVLEHKIFAYEALVRGPNGEGATDVLERVDSANRYAFDQACRVKAVSFAPKLKESGTGAKLSINFLPNAVYEAKACIRATLEAASLFNLKPEQIIFEFTESEAIDPLHLLRILHAYKEIGFQTAIDDFGSGYSSLSLLAEFQPDIVKIDMALIRDIHLSRPKQVMMSNILPMLNDLVRTVICEGIETVQELEFLKGLGVRYYQGFLFGRPAFERFETQ